MGFLDIPWSIPDFKNISPCKKYFYSPWYELLLKPSRTGGSTYEVKKKTPQCKKKKIWRSCIKTKELYLRKSTNSESKRLLTKNSETTGWYQTVFIVSWAAIQTKCAITFLEYVI